MPVLFSICFYQIHINLTNDCASITKTLMMGVKLMTDRYKKILTRKVKVSAKISKCHKKNLHIFLHSNDCKTPYLDIYIVPWLITTSCLISQFQISGRKFETLGRGFKLSAEDLDIRPRV